MITIANMEEVFKSYTRELDRRLLIVDRKVKDECMKYGQYVRMYIRQTTLVGDLYNREGYTYMNNELCGVDECYEETGIYEIDSDNKWILEDDWESKLEIKLAEMVKKAIEVGAKHGDEIKERKLKEAIEIVENNGFFVSKG
ncbi:MAG: hypothetical protein ACRDD8_16440 [Bacteroidales bacterium]